MPNRNSQNANDRISSGSTFICRARYTAKATPLTTANSSIRPKPRIGRPAASAICGRNKITRPNMPRIGR
jgi:hypothetical protein